MSLRGNVDGMEGGYIVGWAVGAQGNAMITITNEMGDVAAKGRASRHRPDLASLGLGRTSFAFRLAVAFGAAPQRLHVRADGEELPGSPLITGAGQFDLHCVLEAATVTGWVTERVPDFTPPSIDIVDQHGNELGHGVARAEAAPADPLFAPARFAIELEDGAFGTERLLHVQIAGHTLATLPCRLTLTGHLETVTTETISGWLISPEVPGRRFTVEIRRDGQKLAPARCEHAREDVRAHFPDCTTPGFSASLKTLPAAQESCTISLRLAGSDAELFDGPYLIASRAAAVSAAHRLAAHAENASLPDAERAMLQQALQDFLLKARQQERLTVPRVALETPPPRLMVLIPVYRGVEITRDCIESVLAQGEDATLLLINDASPEPGMAEMLAGYAPRPGIVVLTNAENLGFVRTVNRGFGFASGADILLLNADTILYPGALRELRRVAYAEAQIGTVTALSNNATVFSYPHAQLRRAELPDIGWDALARAALQIGTGTYADAPTGHGFCLFIKSEVLARVGLFDEAFGRGYGEENDFCLRAAGLGYRNVAAGGVLVEHKESISFAGEKSSLIAQNLPRLNAVYPEYTPVVMAFEQQDGLRALRWGLDRLRLERAARRQRFILLVGNHLEGGTAKAMEDIEQHIGYGDATKLHLRGIGAGMMELSCDAPLLRARFMPDEIEKLFQLLEAAKPSHVLVHQLLGFDAALIARLSAWTRPRHGVFYAHDFYAACPRVTMIDAVGRFCALADSATCARCVAMDGAHETSVLGALTPAEHRALFGTLFAAFRHIVAPSEDARRHLARAFPAQQIEVVPHPESRQRLSLRPRSGDGSEIVLLGAIGPHKGSQHLKEIAQLARLTHPTLRFRVIGHTNIDAALTAIGNVTITGRYKPEELGALLAETQGWLALFLSTWPETYSYTLSEAVRAGLVPLVPDIGAPAERVRAARYGAVFPFPSPPDAVLEMIDGIIAGRLPVLGKNASPASFFPATSVRRGAAILALSKPALAVAE
jgi:GT2 family glycosyltransferase/glycosyltransferase involved in cell wall biosynthesis